MKRRLMFLIGATCAISVFGYGLRGSAQQASAAANHQAVLSKYCVTCHNERVKSGNLVLTTLDISAPGKNIESWEKVIRKVGTGAMPPVGRARPDKATADSLVQYLETELDRAALAHPDPGRTRLQRLFQAPR